MIDRIASRSPIRGGRKKSTDLVSLFLFFLLMTRFREGKSSPEPFILLPDLCEYG
uniref:Uncharacterized protein n=1 Tax=Arundo donax TaxID=35708 RepID=A0A0A9F1Y7_ARUDO